MFLNPGKCLIWQHVLIFDWDLSHPRLCPQENVSGILGAKEDRMVKASSRVQQKCFRKLCKNPKTANVVVSLWLLVWSSHSCDFLSSVLLPVDVPAILSALPEEDRLDAVERYSLLLCLSCSLFSTIMPDAVRGFRRAYGAWAGNPNETRLTASRTPEEIRC